MYQTGSEGNNAPGQVFKNNQTVASSLVSEHRISLIRADSLLRKLGFFGCFVTVLQGHESKQIKRIGFCPPPWLFSSTTSLELEISRTLTNYSSFLSSSWRLVVQNRVSKSSRFMLDCRKGDLEGIKQALRDGTGSLHDRTICRGQTPLLVRAIPLLSTMSVYRLK